MNACADRKFFSSVHKKLLFLRIFGFTFFAAGVILGILHLVPPVICSMTSAFGGSWIAISFVAKEGAIRDEMVKHVDMLSGYYSFISTLYVLFILGILNFFIAISLSVSVMVLALILYMSVTFIGIRYYFLKRGILE